MHKIKFSLNETTKVVECVGDSAVDWA